MEGSGGEYISLTSSLSSLRKGVRVLWKVILLRLAFSFILSSKKRISGSDGMLTRSSLNCEYICVAFKRSKKGSVCPLPADCSSAVPVPLK